LRVCIEFDDVNSAGKLLDVHASRSPTLDSRVGGTCNAEVEFSK